MTEIENLLSIQLSNKIQQIVSTTNAEDFLNTYQTFNSFLSSPYGGAFQHFTYIASGEEIYKNVCEQLRNVLNNTANNDPKSIKSENYILEEPKKRVKKPYKPSKVAGFVDTLILAFVTGSFIGMIILNVYSKIAQNF